MNISCIQRNLIICAYLGPAACGLGGFATRVDAQSAAAPADSRSGSIAASITQGTDWMADDGLSKHVKAALHVDPYFYDEHVTVSVENGSVVLRGFVFSDWELQDALRIARKAAGSSSVVDNLLIKLG
jgi:osmotically-inducible protein OsmY